MLIQRLKRVSKNEQWDFMLCKSVGLFIFYFVTESSWDTCATKSYTTNHFKTRQKIPEKFENGTNNHT